MVSQKVTIKNPTGLHLRPAGILCKEAVKYQALFATSVKGRPLSSTKDGVTVTLVASIVGIITLLGAAVGLMNIMLVAVNERTREIGTRMALGAKPRMIRQQFLFESILISQLGGVCGMVLGIGCGNLIALVTDGAFVVPWGWLLIGLGLCLVVGIGSGYLPARRAAGLNPVEALRYE